MRDLLMPGLADIVGRVPVDGLDADLSVADDGGIVCHWRRGNWTGAFVALSASEVESGDYVASFSARCQDELMRAVRLETVR